MHTVLRLLSRHESGIVPICSAFLRNLFPEIERAETYNPRFAVGQLIEEASKERFKGKEQNHTRELIGDKHPPVADKLTHVLLPYLVRAAAF